MELEDIYKTTQQESKLNDDAFLLDCLEFYKKSTRAIKNLSHEGSRNSDFYDRLIKVTKPDSSKIDVKSEEKFYVMMTNIWIQNIMSLTEEELNKLEKNVAKKYRETKQLLSKIKKVNSMQEVISLYKSISKNLSEETEMDKNRYFWRFDQEKSGTLYSREGDSGFYHIQSRYVNARKTKNIGQTDYRLYINCSNEDIFELMTLYVNLCMKKNIPYYFKFGTNNKRRDKFIVYCPKELLSENISILREIARIRPEIPKKAGEMLSLVGKIDNWIGIASEPKKIQGKGKFSYNTMRAEILEDASELLMIRFAERYRRKNVRYKNQIKNFDLIIAKHAAEIIIKEMIRDKKIDKNDPNIQKYINEIINQILTKKGNITLLEQAIEKIKQVMPEKNNLLASNSHPIFTIKLSNGQTSNFSLYTTDKLLKSLIDVMKEIDPQYIERYRQVIKEKCNEYQVDPENFIFNKSAKSEFKQLAQKTNKTNQITGKWNKENFEYIMNLLSVIPKEILMMKLENNMTLNQYFQEVVVDRMDRNHNYINDDGTITPVNIIIEKTINRVKIKNGWNKDNFEYVMNLLETLPKEILYAKIGEIDELNLDVVLYNNITVKQYFQEVVVDRMDENHNFIRYDGSLIPVSTYTKFIVEKINHKKNKSR